MWGMECDQGEEGICAGTVYHSWHAMIRTQPHFCDILAKDASPKSNHEQTSGKLRLRDTLQNNWHVIF